MTLTDTISPSHYWEAYDDNDKYVYSGYYGKGIRGQVERLLINAGAVTAWLVTGSEKTRVQRIWSK